MLTVPSAPINDSLGAGLRGPWCSCIASATSVLEIAGSVPLSWKRTGLGDVRGLISTAAFTISGLLLSSWTCFSSAVMVRAALTSFLAAISATTLACAGRSYIMTILLCQRVYLSDRSVSLFQNLRHSSLARRVYCGRTGGLYTMLTGRPLLCIRCFYDVARSAIFICVSHQLTPTR